MVVQDWLFRGIWRNSWYQIPTLTFGTFGG